MVLAKCTLNAPCTYCHGSSLGNASPATHFSRLCHSREIAPELCKLEHQPISTAMYLVLQHHSREHSHHTVICVLPFPLHALRRRRQT